MVKFAFGSCLVALLLCCTTNVSARVIGGNDMMDQEMTENLCALTFDDGPSIFTPQLLDLLKEHQIHATFFMLGQMVNNYPSIALRVAEEGHEIASHTHRHRNLKRLSYAAQWEEIEKGYESLARLGIYPQYMRPPYGSFDSRTEAIADVFGLHVVLWSVDSKDWKRLPDDYSKIPSVRSQAFEERGMYGVFLFHDIHKRTVEDLPRIVRELRQGGCERFVTLSEYLAGIVDPEPALLMTRRTVRKTAPEAVPQPIEASEHNEAAALQLPQIQSETGTNTLLVPAEAEKVSAPY